MPFMLMPQKFHGLGGSSFLKNKVFISVIHRKNNESGTVADNETFLCLSESVIFYKMALDKEIVDVLNGNDLFLKCYECKYFCIKHESIKYNGTILKAIVKKHKTV